MKDPNALELRVEVHIRTSGGGTPAAYGDLHISETVEIPVSGFTELCKILGQFHELAEKIRKDRS